MNFNRFFQLWAFCLLALIKQAVAMDSLAAFQKDSDFRNEDVNADLFADMRHKVEGLSQLTDPPTFFLDDSRENTAEMRALYFSGLNYRGNETKVFGWLGIPQNDGRPLPGVVLVHGGGGTAYKEWVKRWNAHGFAALAIAVEGQTDTRKSSDSKHPRWTSHQWAGPSRRGIYSDSEEQIEDQWIYHAVANSILANSLLRSLPQVDENRVGIMGVSWGGVITSTVIGLDHRFSFAVPVYGCGGLADSANQYGRALHDNQVYQQVWDPLLWLNRATMPILWLSWPGETHFPLDRLKASYRSASGTRVLSLVPNMGHSHPAAWSRPESYEFAKSIVQTGIPWGVEVSMQSDGDLARAVFRSKRSINIANLIWTTDSGVSGERRWNSIAAEIVKEDGNYEIVAPVPPEATAYFMNAEAEGSIISSKIEGLQF